LGGISTAADPADERLPTRRPAPIPARPDPGTTVGLHSVVERVLDATVGRAVAEPLPVHSADDVRASVQGPATAGMTSLVLPALARLSGRWTSRVVNVGSRVSFSLKTLLATLPPVATSVVVGTRELHALASLVVQRLRAEGLPVEHRFVQRVTVNAYVWPSGGRSLADAHAPALPRVAGLWATRPLAAERSGEWAGRAADAIEAADLRAEYSRYQGPAALDV